MLEFDFIDVSAALPYAFERDGLHLPKLGDHGLKFRQLLTRDLGELSAHQVVVRISKLKFLNIAANRGFGSGRLALLLESLGDVRVVKLDVISGALDVGLAKPLRHTVSSVLVKRDLGCRTLLIEGEGELSVDDLEEKLPVAFG